MSKQIDVKDSDAVVQIEETAVTTTPKKIFIPITLTILGIIIAIVIYITYVNVLPFGYKRESTLTVGQTDDTLNEFKILPSSTWGNRETDANGTSFRTLDGSAYLLYEPGVVLTDATVNANISGENVALYTPEISFDKNSVSWKSMWDLTSKLPSSFTGTPYLFDNCTYFDGKSLLTLTDSKNKYEKGPFTVYVEWLPMQDLDSQQLVGHFNWEIFQSKNFVVFQLGRTSNPDVPFYSIKAPIDAQFFNKKHTVIVQYKPDLSDGYIEMFLDGKFIERKYIKNAVLEAEYGDKDLTLGWSSHNYQKNPYFKGCMYSVAFAESIVINPATSVSFSSKEPTVELPIVGSGKVFNININVEKK
jgi:hypothetical protein